MNRRDLLRMIGVAPLAAKVPTAQLDTYTITKLSNGMVHFDGTNAGDVGGKRLRLLNEQINQVASSGRNFMLTNFFFKG